MSIFSDETNKIIQIGRILYEKQLICGNEGNISKRLPNNEILITPSGICKGALIPDNLVKVDLSGNVISGIAQPSSEIAMHLNIYSRRDDINACVHAHPPYITAFSVAGIAISDSILPEIAANIGSVALADYATPGTEELAKTLNNYIDNCNAIILKNHGIVTCGLTLDKAFYTLEMIEHSAKIEFLARQLGRIDHLNKKEIAKLRKT